MRAVKTKQSYCCVQTCFSVQSTRFITIITILLPPFMTHGETTTGKTIFYISVAGTTRSPRESFVFNRFSSNITNNNCYDKINDFWSGTRYIVSCLLVEQKKLYTLFVTLQRQYIINLSRSARKTDEILTRLLEKTARLPKLFSRLKAILSNAPLTLCFYKIRVIYVYNNL